MRIRTIKPEFWTHTQMTRLPHDTRLMAIALLNLSDDEGYFEADIEYIRASVMFREESTNVRRMIDELSRGGYISLSRMGSDRPIGRVINFSEHQRIDRPKPSKLKALWIDDESTIDRRTLDDLSCVEGKGKEVISTHTLGESPKASFPKLEDVLKACSIANIPEDVGTKFWHHFEAISWINKNGHPITNWHSKLSSWWMDERQREYQKASHKPNGPQQSTLWQDKTRLEVIQREIDRIKKGASTNAMGEMMIDQPTRDKLKQLSADAKQIKERIVRG